MIRFNSSIQVLRVLQRVISSLWIFEQDILISEINPFYLFGVEGIYPVQLITQDSNNCIDTVIQNVFIQPSPVGGNFHYQST